MRITDPSDLPPMDLVVLGEMLGGDADLVKMIVGNLGRRFIAMLRRCKALRPRTTPSLFAR